MQNKKAFTLAEILITITLLGVLAAIIVPTTIRNHEKKLILTGVAESYSLLTRVVDRAIVENGTVKHWNRNSNDTWGINTNAKRFAETYLIPYLSISYICDKNNPNLPCFANNNRMTGANGTCAATQIGFAEGSGYGFVLKNGMSMVVNMHSQNSGRAFISVDINGPKKGPSVVGRDVFVFNINSRGVEPGAYADDEYWWWSYNNKCTGDGLQTGSQYMGVSGTNCTKWIVKNNFHFPNKNVYDIDKLLTTPPCK